MTIKIIDTTASYKPIAAGLKLPVSMAGLQFVFLYGGTALSQSLQNWAPGGANAVPVGSLTFDAQSLTTSGPNNYLQTAMGDSTDVTFIAVARELTNPTYDGIIVGNGTTSYLTNLAFATDTGGYSYLNGCRAGNNIITGDAIPNNTYKCVSLRHSNSDEIGYVVNHTDNVTISFIAPYPSSYYGSSYLIGANYNSEFVGEIQHLFTIGFSRRLSSTEMSAMYAWCQQYCAQLPTSVTI